MTALATQLLDGLFEQRAAAVKLLRNRDHRDHHLEISCDRRACQCPQLRAKYIQMTQRQPYAAHAKKWIEVAGLRQTRDWLVTPGIEGPDGHGPAVGPFKHSLVDLILFFLGRENFAALKQKLGPH